MTECMGQSERLDGHGGENLHTLRESERAAALLWQKCVGGAPLLLHNFSPLTSLCASCLPVIAQQHHQQHTTSKQVAARVFAFAKHTTELRQKRVQATKARRFEQTLSVTGTICALPTQQHTCLHNFKADLVDKFPSCWWVDVTRLQQQPLQRKLSKPFLCDISVNSSPSVVLIAVVAAAVVSIGLYLSAFAASRQAL
ncbi:unnamed protein product [Ceratitis capitata]|uniref:(Mediterranean fruit fly) hypothetical protein n=1 Tax=Ceratitis capitata TaxID=7213 RepID=A0A811UPE5_CERCA|nr:unnamed protein product [Ceratitis capitata]